MTGRGEVTMLIEKSLDKDCPECGEPMEVTADYGLHGHSLKCPYCLHVEEVIDLQQTNV